MGSLIECRDTLKKYANTVFQVAKKQRKHPTKDLWSGYPSWEFETVHRDEQGNLFSEGQLYFLDGYNPFTKKKNLRTLSKAPTTVFPLSTLTNDTCPDMLGKSTAASPRVFYVKSSDFVDWDYYLSFPEFKVQASVSIPLNYFDDISSHFAYKFTMKKPFTTLPALVQTRDIQQIETLYTPPPLNKKSIRKDIVPTDKNIHAAMDWLRSYLRVGTNITAPVQKQVLALGIRLPDPVRVYRGLYLLDQDMVKTLGLDKLRVGDRIELKNRDKVMSWSTDLCVSKYFATRAIMNSFEFRSKMKEFHFGVVLTTVLKPSDVLVDTRLLTQEARFNYQQSEVMTRRTNDQGKPLTFECTIYQLFVTAPYVRKETQRRFLPVLSFGPLLKDLKSIRSE